jgi:hypothetical protein
VVEGSGSDKKVVQPPRKSVDCSCTPKPLTVTAKASVTTSKTPQRLDTGIESRRAVWNAGRCGMQGGVECRAVWNAGRCGMQGGVECRAV